MSAATLAAAGLSGAALADPSAADQPAQAGDHGFSPEDRAAFLDARAAALKAGLKLTAAQEKTWPAVETALREVWKARADRAADWREKWKDIREHHNVIEGLRLRAQGLTSRGAELSKLADAAKPLFDSLDDAQKRRLGVLLFHVLMKPDGREHWGSRVGH
ncbi:Spy/CpxP family protein refolding chaperone [Methylocystis sp. JAN1]|uniref:Spy/CpxP family protein refolding chaperone n=1 Tax=Methylocystis sp. JAN1 TaxID=3397211 RepID=UPI003FA26092